MAISNRDKKIFDWWTDIALKNPDSFTLHYVTFDKARSVVRYSQPILNHSVVTSQILKELYDRKK